MPIKRCYVDGKPGFKWGDSGKCYTGKGAYQKALAQAKAIFASGYKEPNQTGGKKGSKK